MVSGLTHSSAVEIGGRWGHEGRVFLVDVVGTPKGATDRYVILETAETDVMDSSKRDRAYC